MADSVIYIALTVEGNNLISTDKSGAVRVFDIEIGEITKCLEASGDKRTVWAVKFCRKDTGVAVYRQKDSAFVASI